MNQINSDYFGMTFWFDDNNDLMYCPTNIDGTADKVCSGYVSEWDDWEGVSVSRLFAIVSELVTLKEAQLDA